MMSNSTLSMFVQVIERRVEAEDVIGLTLADPHGRPLPAFSAGAHIDVRISDGLVRQYSLIGQSDTRDRYHIAILREPASRGGSTALHDTLKQGDMLQISAPRNHFELEPATHTLLFAGGIGITPILCMFDRLIQTHADVELHYAARTRTRMAFAERLETSDTAGRTHFYYDDRPEAGRLDVAAIAAAAPRDTHVYVCGPAGFIDHVLSTFKACDWPQDQLHCEHFSGAAQRDEDDTSFEVKIASSGATFTVPEDKSVYQVLTENGIEIMVSCEQGVCGTCLTRILEGEPDHRDLYLEEHEHAANDQFTPCCSRAKSRLLVLDL
ncbi:PDR/VanB family oxidoreductase [Kushneria sp. Sum13]|uniref:PDR/VanB family oxidoreductase n=1 Tax=Kushneria sp. Sum13 TaxID=3459196 RepID=UPI0040454BF8